MSFVIAGIGNVGKPYQHNRHNIGFLLLDEIAEHYASGAKKSRYGNQHMQAQIDSYKLHLLWPQKYVNCSGSPIQKFLAFYKIPPKNLLVIHDELDLPIGETRIKFGGSAGGHNGLKDIDRHIGKDYWRLRIGIGHPGHKDAVTSYVLGDFSKKEWQEIFQPLCEKLTQELPQIITEKIL